jgi:pimeloyl-ACP methyl ester carboxylesterase
MKRLAAAAMFVLPLAPPHAQDPVAQAPSRFATLDGLKVHYKVLGSGEPTLVLVHGWTCNLGFWKGQAALADSARLVLVDLPGHGQSDKPERTYSMELMARAVEAVLRDAKIERGVLAGHSMGTPVAWQFARLYPEKTQALIAIDGSFRTMFKTDQDRDKWASRYRGADYKTSMSNMLDGLIGKTASPALRDEIKTQMLLTPQHVASSAAYEMSDPRIYATEPPLVVPVLGLYASYWPADYRKTIEAFIPNLDYQVVLGAGHFLMMEKPEETNDLVRAFLRKQGLAKPR